MTPPFCPAPYYRAEVLFLREDAVLLSLEWYPAPRVASHIRVALDPAPRVGVLTTGTTVLVTDLRPVAAGESRAKLLVRLGAPGQLPHLLTDGQAWYNVDGSSEAAETSRPPQGRAHDRGFRV